MSKKSLEAYNRLTDFDTFDFYDLTVRSRDIILSWFEKLLSEGNDYNIIYRPNHGELLDEKITGHCQKYGRLYCISSYSVKQWITTSDVILNWYSTAGTEAFFSGKANLFLRPIPFDENMEYEMFSDSCKAATYESFRYYVSNDKQISDYYSDHPLDEKIGKYYYNGEGYTFIRICDLIEKMLHSSKYDMKNIRPARRKLPDHLLKNLIKYFLFTRYKAKDPLVIKACDYSRKLRNSMFKCSESETENIITRKEEKAVLRKLDRIYDKLVR